MRELLYLGGTVFIFEDVYFEFEYLCFYALIV